MLRKELIDFFSHNNNYVMLDDYINFCLYSNNGFYNNGNPFGKTGAFVTSPMISSLFGEIIALYLINYIKNKDINYAINIIEIGSGNGQLLQDIIRIFERFKMFNISFFSIEKSKTNINYQKKALEKYNIQYLQNIDDFSSYLPCFFISNELLDAYPINQYKYIRNCFEIHKIRLFDGKLKSIWEVVDDPSEIKKYIKFLQHPSFKDGDIIELSLQNIKDFIKICKIIDNNSGGMIYCDYGYTQPQYLSTLQAIYKHQKVGIFDFPMESDITHLINFDFFSKVASQNIINHQFIGTVTQGDFLKNNGIILLSEQYIQNAKSDVDINNIKLSVDRLINPKQMGELFKVLTCFK